VRKSCGSRWYLCKIIFAARAGYLKNLFYFHAAKRFAENADELRKIWASPVSLKVLGLFYRLTKALSLHLFPLSALEGSTFAPPNDEPSLEEVELFA